tara:strand:- start:426 stop:611 length:186 start_codon:yes stop_codon:yes gene_type:complete
MIAIQFGTYEIIKSKLMHYNSETRIETAISRKQAARAAKALKIQQREEARATAAAAAAVKA